MVRPSENPSLAVDRDESEFTPVARVGVSSPNVYVA